MLFDAISFYSLAARLITKGSKTGQRQCQVSSKERKEMSGLASSANWREMLIEKKSVDWAIRKQTT